MEKRHCSSVVQSEEPRNFEKLARNPVFRSCFHLFWLIVMPSDPCVERDLFPLNFFDWIIPGLRERFSTEQTDWHVQSNRRVGSLIRKSLSRNLSRSIV